MSDISYPNYVYYNAKDIQELPQEDREILLANPNQSDIPQYRFDLKTLAASGLSQAGMDFLLEALSEAVRESERNKGREIVAEGETELSELHGDLEKLLPPEVLKKMIPGFENS